jgi:quercetin dioxygenase-like cupin family protein
MRSASIALLLALVGRAVPAQVKASEESAVPVFQEPRHHVVFENALVRILDVRVAPGDTTVYHLHANRHIGVVISGARTWEQFRGQAASPVDSVADSAGSILDNSNASLPYTHRVGNADSVSFRYVVAQLLAPSEIVAPALPTKSGLKVHRDSFGARVYCVTLAPGQSTPKHRHAPPGLTVQVSPGTLRLEGTAAEGASEQPGASSAAAGCHACSSSRGGARPGRGTEGSVAGACAGAEC